MSLGKSHAEIVVNLHTLFSYTLSMNTKTKDLRQSPKHRSPIGKKVQLFVLVCFAGSIGGFIYSNFDR